MPSPWTCPECSVVYKLPDGKKPPARCKKCADWKHFEAEVIAAEPAPEPESPLPTFTAIVTEKPPSVWKPRRRMPRWAWVAFLLAGAAIAVGVMQVRRAMTPAPRHEIVKEMTADEQRQLRADLFAFSQVEMRKYLKSPKSATFEPEYTVDIQPDLISPDKIEAVINGHLESQNSLGVFLRIGYTLRLKGSTIDRKWATRAAFLGDDMQYMDPALMQEILANRAAEPQPPTVKKWKRTARYHNAKPQTTPYVAIRAKSWKLQYQCIDSLTVATELEDSGERTSIATPGTNGEIEFSDGPCSRRFFISGNRPWSIYIYEPAE